MNDRELLELAAKAAGMADAEWQDMSGWGEVRYGYSEAIWSEAYGDYWNPLKDDGDALRLAVRVRAFGEDDFIRQLGAARFAQQEEDDTAAYRTAIVRIAAEIGRAMP